MKPIFSVLLFFMPFLLLGQYTADFSIAGQGVDGGNLGPPAGCSNQDVTTCPNYDVSSVDWLLSSPGNTFNINQSSDGLFTTGGNLFLSDTDGTLCWESPDLSMGGATQTITVTFTATGLDGGIETVTLTWFVDGMQDGIPLSSTTGTTFNPTTSAGNTLQFEVCASTSLGSENVTFSNIASSASLLPIQLTSFDASLTREETVRLTWLTATEINNDYMAVERSQNGQHFDEIGRVAGKGDSYTAQQYEFTDERPMTGKNYYRLRQVDFDGGTTYHKIELVHVGDQVTMQMVPNPVNQYMNLILSEEIEEESQLMIFSMDGQLIKQVRIPPFTTNFQSDVSELPSGMYLVELLTGREVQSMKLAKR